MKYVWSFHSWLAQIYFIKKMYVTVNVSLSEYCVSSKEFFCVSSYIE